MKSASKSKRKFLESNLHPYNTQRNQSQLLYAKHTVMNLEPQTAVTVQW